MKATLVNMTRWRTDHIVALYEAALARASNPTEPWFVVLAETWGGPCVEARRNGGEITIRFAKNKTGDGSRREQSPLAAIARGRTLDDGTFGQLAKWLVLALECGDMTGYPSRTCPKWAKDLPFTERVEREAPLKILKSIEAKSGELGLGYDLRCMTSYMEEADVKPLLSYARITAAGKFARDRDYALTECREARKRLQTCRSEDRKRNRYLDQLDRIVESHEPSDTAS